MPKFQKRPVVVSAWPIRRIREIAQKHWAKLPECVASAYERGELLFDGAGVQIKTLEGWMIGGADDWIIRGLKGELYPCKADIFAATYDRVPCDNMVTGDCADTCGSCR